MGERWDRFVEALARFMEWLGSEKAVKTFEGILKLVVLGCQIAEKFNAPLAGEEKAKFVRLLVRMVKYGSRAEIDALAAGIVELKRSGEIEDLEAWELDKALGDGIAIFMAEQQAAGGGGAPEHLEY